MPIESKFTRCELDHPNRCKAATAHGQCPYLAMEGTEGCPMHSGPTQRLSIENKNKRNYRLSKWQARVNELADNEQVKSLREEIGIMRMLMEEMIAMCPDTSSLLMYSNRIADLVTRIEKLVTSCHRLEQSTGLLMDKTTALSIGAQIVEIVSKYVTDDEALDAIGSAIVEAILKKEKVENGA